MTLWYVGVGSNIRPRRHIRLAVRLLIGHPHIRLAGSSTFYRTKALGVPGAPDFLNGVFELRTDLPRHQLAEALAVIETATGRQRAENRNAPRTLDLDLLLSRVDSTDGWRPGEEIRSLHRDVMERAFVAIPLHELASDLRLDAEGSSLGQVVAGFEPGWGTPQRLFSRRIKRLLTVSGEGICALDACQEPH
ncbi:MAG: 2-amino-4-hydroxy-6-hydroxymethyldihydropteridine diphosphokinase [Gemmatimonadota bacterium]